MKKHTLKVREVITSPVHICLVDDSLERAAALLWEHDCGRSPVLDTEGIVPGRFDIAWSQSMFPGSALTMLEQETH